MLDFVALDFETANKFKNSACFGGYYRKGRTNYQKAYSLIQASVYEF
ncbi:MAG: hypothetical protein ACLRZ2_04695 [Veillonella sp.]